MSKMNFIIFMSVLILSHGIGTADKRAGKCSENFFEPRIELSKQSGNIFEQIKANTQKMH